MSTEIIIPDTEMFELAKSSLKYANGYFSTFSKSVGNENSRFDNDLLYQLAVMSVEKYFIALLARYDWNATHHMPIAMYKEALQFDVRFLAADLDRCSVRLRNVASHLSDWKHR